MYCICKFTCSCRNTDRIYKLICSCIYANRSIFWLIALTIKFNCCLFLLVASNTLNGSNSSSTQHKMESCVWQFELLLSLKRVRLFLDSISRSGSEKSSFALSISMFWLLLGFVLISIEYKQKKTLYIIVMVYTNYICQNRLLIPAYSPNFSIVYAKMNLHYIWFTGDSLHKLYMRKLSSHSWVFP